jgi:hypothetical protein
MRSYLKKVVADEFFIKKKGIFLDNIDGSVRLRFIAVVNNLRRER